MQLQLASTSQSVTSNAVYIAPLPAGRGRCAAAAAPRSRPWRRPGAAAAASAGRRPAPAAAGPGTPRRSRQQWPADMRWGLSGIHCHHVQQYTSSSRKRNVSAEPQPTFLHAHTRCQGTKLRLIHTGPCSSASPARRLSRPPATRSAAAAPPPRSSPSCHPAGGAPICCAHVQHQDSRRRWHITIRRLYHGVYLISSRVIRRCRHALQHTMQSLVRKLVHMQRWCMLAHSPAAPGGSPRTACRRGRGRPAAGTAPRCRPAPAAPAPIPAPATRTGACSHGADSALLQYAALHRKVVHHESLQAEALQL